jgi:hypothetical protein
MSFENWERYRRKRYRIEGVFGSMKLKDEVESRFKFYILKRRLSGLRPLGGFLVLFDVAPLLNACLSRDLFGDLVCFLKSPPPFGSFVSLKKAPRRHSFVLKESPFEDF